MVAEGTKPKNKGGRPPVIRDFYGSVLDAAHRRALEHAGDIDGLDKEIALLRERLRGLLESGSDQGDESGSEEKERNVRFQLMVRGMDVLARLLAARYRLSNKDRQDFIDAAVILRDGLDVQFYREESDDS
jgi:hypothetical protein